MTLSEHVWHDKDLSLQKPSIGLDFAALRQQWCRLCITEIYSKETKSNRNKQTNISIILSILQKVYARCQTRIHLLQYVC